MSAFEEVVYEGYGPGGVAVLVQAVTDNRNRTVAEVRNVFARSGGSLGESGSHDPHFVPQLEVIPPGAKAGPSEARPYYTNRQVLNAAAGNWTLRVSRLDSNDSESPHRRFH